MSPLQMHRLTVNKTQSRFSCNASTSCCRVKSKQARRQGGTMPEKLHFSLLSVAWGMHLFTQAARPNPLSCIKRSLSPKRKTRGNGIVLGVIPHRNVEQGAGAHLFCPGLELHEQCFRERRSETPGGTPSKREPGRCWFWPEEALKRLRMFWLFFRHTRNNINANTECLNRKGLDCETFL